MRVFACVESATKLLLAVRRNCGVGKLKKSQSAELLVFLEPVLFFKDE